MSYRIKPASFPRTGHRIEKYDERFEVWNPIVDGGVDGAFFAANPHVVTSLWADYVREVVET